MKTILEEARDALIVIQSIASGSTTANSLPNLARIAGEALEKIYAADRASRQVANKAEVDMSSLQRYDESESGLIPTPDGEYVVLSDVKALLATPPATTGASTARDQALEEAAKLMDPYNEEGTFGAINAAMIRALKGRAGASTVLTDERKYTQADMERYALLVRDAAIEREVAAQAGQVAVPGRISMITELVAAMRRYEMDADSYEDTPHSHREMMKRAEAMIATPSPAKESK